MKKKLSIYWIYIITATMLTIILNIVSRRIPAFAEWYSSHIYAVSTAVLASVTGLLPFSVYELLIVAAVILVIYGIVRIVMFTLKKNKSGVLHVLKIGLCLLISVLLIFTLNSGINYHRYPFSYYSGLTIEKNDKETLLSACMWLIDETNALVPYINVKEYDGNLGDDVGTIFSMNSSLQKKEAVTAMKKLGNEYDVMKGVYPKPKAMLFSIVMSYCDLTGVYSPFGIEANYNHLVPDYVEMFTICHELSHLRGFMREDEANFIAFLACTGSDNADVRYAGHLSGLVYLLNCVYKECGATVYTKVYKTMDPQLINDLHYNNVYWAQFETPVAEVADKVNDTYLKANAQTDGTKSYGRVVDLLLAYYKQKIKLS